MESTAAAWHDIHYAALQRDRNIAKSLAPIGQQIYRTGAHAQIRDKVKKVLIPTSCRCRERTAPNRRRPLLPDQKKPSFFAL
ncbi:hypothetical protein [Bradyrhizobium sp.]|uniref:hypothetical protein n=1 Tax=Bradyrhizobium sp. TaxID=376 RepID=UPI0039E4C71A